MPDIDIERYVAESRKAQGLPRHVEDEGVAARIVGLLATSSERANAAGGSAASGETNKERRRGSS